MILMINFFEVWFDIVIVWLFWVMFIMLLLNWDKLIVECKVLFGVVKYFLFGRK